MDFLRVLACLNESVDAFIHFTKLVTMVDCRLDLADVHSILLVTSGERLQDVFNSRDRVDGLVLSHAE